MIDFYNKNIYFHVLVILNVQNFIGDVMVSVLASGVVDRGFESRSGQIKVFVASPRSMQH
jgi:hypothetical protein